MAEAAGNVVEAATGEGALSTVCILAGGLGSRLGGYVDQTPKPLLPVAGKPFLLHQLALLASYGAERAVLCVGYLGDMVEATIGPERFGIQLAYSYDGPKLAGTLGAVREALPLLGRRFLVLYGDTYLRVDYRAFDRQWKASGLPGAMSVLHNQGRWDRSNVEYADSLVVRYNKGSPSEGMDWIDYGLGGLTVAALERVPRTEPDLSELYAALARRGELFGFEATERFYEIGTPAALEETGRFLETINS